MLRLILSLLVLISAPAFAHEEVTNTSVEERQVSLYGKVIKLDEQTVRVVLSDTYLFEITPEQLDDFLAWFDSQQTDTFRIFRTGNSELPYKISTDYGDFYLVWKPAQEWQLSRQMDGNYQLLFPTHSGILIRNFHDRIINSLYFVPDTPESLAEIDFWKYGDHMIDFELYFYSSVQKKRVDVGHLIFRYAEADWQKVLIMSRDYDLLKVGVWMHQEAQNFEACIKEAAERQDNI